MNHNKLSILIPKPGEDQAIRFIMVKFLSKKTFYYPDKAACREAAAVWECFSNYIFL